MSLSRRGHGVASALHEVDRDHRVHRRLDRDAARLSLALPAVPVADREQRSLDVHPEVARGPRAHLRGVHVPAVRVGDERGTRFEGSRARRRPSRASVPAAAPRRARPRSPDRSRSVRPGPPRRSRRAPGADRAASWSAASSSQRSEERHRARRRPVARWLDRDEVDRERVTRLGTFDEERPGLRIHERELDHARDVVVRPADLAAERVLGPQLEDVSGLDRSDGRHAAERPCELRRIRTVGVHVHGASIGDAAEERGA